MDGGGRLARSRRSPGPRTVLGAASIGMAVLSRAVFGSVLTRRTAARGQPRFVELLERRLPRRAGLIATLMLLAASAGLGTVKGGHAERVLASLGETRNALANSAGFRITSVAINGR